MLRTPTFALALATTTFLALPALVAGSAAPLHATDVPFEAHACKYVEVGVKAPASQVVPFVPAPFVVAASVGGVASLLVGAASCSEAASGADVGTASFLWTDVKIQAPADPVIRGTGIAVWLYRIEHLVLPDVYARANAAAGIEQDFVDAIDVTVGPTVSFDVRDGAIEHRAISPAATNVALGSVGVRYREYGPAIGGIGVLEATLTSDDSGATGGLVLPGEGSVTAVAVGAANAGTIGHGSTYGFEDARVFVIAQP